MNIIILSLTIITLLLTTAIALTYDTNPAFAQIELQPIEIGKNFDREQLNENSFKWTSHYERINNDNKWNNYIFTDNINELVFQSAGLNFKFNKSICDFALFQPNSTEQENPIINSFSQEYLIDDIPITTSTCNISSILQLQDSIQFIVSKDTLEIKYNLMPIKDELLELTYSLPNNEGKNSKLTIIETCKDCNPIPIDSTKTQFGLYTFDTKNEIHNALKEQIQEGSDYKITYEKSINDKEVLVIDPTFGYTVNSFDSQIYTNFAVGAACPSASYTIDGTTLNVARGDADLSDGCWRSAFEWDITSIPDGSLVTNTNLRFDITTITTGGELCDFFSMEFRPSTESNARNLYLDSGNGTEFVDSSALCQSVSDGKVLDLGASADSNINGKLVGNWWGLGVAPYSDTRSSSGFIRSIFRLNDAELEITYNVVPNLPTNLKTNTFSNSIINMTWTAPSDNGGSAITGYKIWRETPTGGGFSVLVLNTGTAGTKYNNTGLTSGLQYNYKVAAWNAVGLGANSTAKSNFTRTDAPTALKANTISNSRIDLFWTAPSGTVTGYKIERETPTGGGFSNLVANTSSTAVTYSNTGLTSNTQYNYRVSAHNMGGTSTVSNQASNYTQGQMTVSILFNSNKTGDAIELKPSVRLILGSPPTTVTNLQILRNQTSINNTAMSKTITVGQTVQLGRTFSNELDATKIYNYSSIVSIQNSSGTFPLTNYTLIRPVYTANYIESAEGNYQINYTQSRTNSFQKLNLVINRENLPANTECSFKDELFEIGDWINVSDKGWFNETVSVTATQNVYVTCYNDALLFGFISTGGSNATLAFVDYINQLGTFAGVPVSFLFVLLMAGLFTGRSAITGIIFVAITIGVMGTMGFLPDINGDPAITAPTWGLIVLLSGIGVFVGKKYF